MIMFTHKRDEDWKSSTMWGKHAIAEQGDPPDTDATEALSVLALQNAPIKTSHTYSPQVVILPLKMYVAISPTNSNIHMCTSCILLGHLYFETLETSWLSKHKTLAK